MDAEIQKIYDLLVDINYPVTLAELKNPTSECMVKVVLTFLSGNSIDGKTIQRVTFEQDQSLSYPEAYQEIISLINLHAVMSRICDRIFIKDFYLTDISSPGVKKARRLIRTLLNFVLYAANKMEELAEPLETIFSRLNTLSEYADKKTRDMELRKQIVLENSKKAAYKEKLLKQIEEMKQRVEDKNKKISILEERALKAKQVKQSKLQANGLVKQQLSKVNEKIAEMESTVVKSPEEYQSQLTNYAQDCADKKAKLQEMVEKLRSKRELTAQFEKVKDFVDKEYEKFPKVLDTHLKSKKLAKVKEDLSKQLNEIQTAVQKLYEETKSSDDISQDDTAKFDAVYALCQKQLALHHKTHKKLRSQLQDVQKRFDEAHIYCEKSRNEKEELNKMIINLEEEIAEFLKDCQSIYNNEIEQQVELERLWKSKHNSDK